MINVNYLDTMNKSWLWSQNWLWQTCNVFVFTFIKHLFKQKNIFHIGCWVKKLIKHIVLIHKQLCLEIVSTTFLLVCFVCLKHYKISFFIKNSIKKRPGNYFHTFFWIFKGTAVIKETVEASMLIWANFDSFAITYLI